jgi:hypothetical protein
LLLIYETIQRPGIESIRVAQRLMFLSVERDFLDVVRRDAFQKQPVFEQMAEQIALSAASDAGDDFDPAVASQRQQPILIAFAFDLLHGRSLRIYESFSMIRIHLLLLYHRIPKRQAEISRLSKKFGAKNS